VTKHLVVNADDLGIASSANLAIRRAFREGIVTSASLMANMAAFQHAVDQVVRRSPDLGIGLHLCLTNGKPVLEPARVPLLVDASGCFHRRFLGLFRLLHSRRRKQALAQIARELRAQARRLDACGIAVDHVDSHQHVHMIPGIFRVAAAIARDRNAVLRISNEAFRAAHRSPARLLPCLFGGGVLKKLVLSRLARAVRRVPGPIRTADHYYGVLDGGKMTLPTLREILRSIPPGLTEINLHPGQADAADDIRLCSRLDRDFIRSPDRAAELAALLDPSLRGEVDGCGIVLVRFRDVLPGLRPPREPGSLARCKSGGSNDRSVD
jgi:predicted glycoside hydrolase/deacetylase ChbG (UPF0249 family)